MEHIGEKDTRSGDSAHRVRVLAVFLFVLGALSAAATLISGHPVLSQIDGSLVSAAYGVRAIHPWLTIPFTAITHMGNDLFLFFLIIVLAVWCVRRGWRGEAAWLLGTAVFARVVGWIAKIQLQLPRPDILEAPPVRVFAGYGFPSGHALMSMAVYGAIALFILRHAGTRKARRTTVAACALLVAAVGFSRIFLGAHWVNDVLGGFLYGGCVLVIAELARIRFTSR